MSGYRDQLEAARLRIESLEANLAERNAALGAREAELREMAAKLGRRDPSTQPQAPQTAWAVTFGAGLIVAVSLFANSHAQKQIHLAEAHLRRAEANAHACEARARAAETSGKADEAPPQQDIAFPLRPSSPQPEIVAGTPEPTVLDDDTFDRGAASRALREAGERARSSCLRAGAPELPLKVKVTFLPGGEASQATTDAPLHATPAGRCLERAFLRTEVPPFTGAPRTVSMSFTWR